LKLVPIKDKKILLGVTGSIAIYKACELARLFIKSQAFVKVVMTPSAKEFISPLTFEALTRQKVLTKESEDWSSNLNHIDYAKWADIFIIAPATANSINKLSKGIADNLLLQSALAFNKPLIIAPAANTNMFLNPITQGSLKMLKVNDAIIVEPQKKLLACNDEGVGALADVWEIYYKSLRELLKDPFWVNRKVVVTGGGTIEKIDEVRYISNFSSGKMGKALALALYLKGAEVCYITTRDSDDLPKDIYTIKVESALEMLDYLNDCLRSAKKGVLSKASLNNPKPIELIKKKPFLFMAAAVADYRPKFSQEGKLKKSILGDEWDLKLIKNPDLLKSIDKEGIITVAFKAEMDSKNGLENAKKALKEKGVDAVCYNLLKGSESFGEDHNKITFITKDKEIEFERSDKLLLAFKIIEAAKELEKSSE